LKFSIVASSKPVKGRILIKAVVFDVGRVILPIEWSNVVKSLGLSDQEGKAFGQKVGHGSHYDLYERGQLSTEDFFSGFSKEYGLHHDKDQLKEAWALLIHPPFDGIHEVLEHLKSQVEVYALSNTNPAHFEKFMSEYTEFSHFHKVFTSFHLNARKPEHEIYFKVVETLQMPPAEILFLDDMAENVHAARNIGMHSEKVENSVEEIHKVLSHYKLWK